jgi:phosphonatase-like hydrolase
VAGTELAVFDMAGTTVDEGNIVYRTLHRAIVESGQDCAFEDILEHGVGKEKLQSIRDVLAARGTNPGIEEAVRIHRRFLKLLEKAYAERDIGPLPGAPEVFRNLKERSIFVVLNTGYTQAVAESLLERLGWSEGREIDLLVTASQVRGSRPMPDMILLAMKSLGVGSPESVVKVGDTVFDIEEGKNAGCGLSIGITTGAHTRERLASARPDHIVDHLAEIPSLI